MHVARDHASPVLHERGEVRGLAARRRAGVDDRLARSRRQQASDQHRRLVLRGEPSLAVRRLTRRRAGGLGGRARPHAVGRAGHDAPPFLEPRGRRGVHAAVGEAGRQQRRRAAQRVQPHRGRRGRVVRLAQRARAVRAESLDPPGDEPLRVRVADGDRVRGLTVAGGLGRRGHPPQHRVHEARGAGVADALGERDRLEARGVRGNAADEQQLVRAHPQNRANRRRQRAQRGAREAGQRPVHLGAVAQRPIRQLRRQGLLGGAEPRPLEQTPEQHAAPRAVGVDPVEDLERYFPRRARLTHRAHGIARRRVSPPAACSRAAGAAPAPRSRWRRPPRTSARPRSASRERR